MARLDDENMLLLSEYEDPYYYFDRLTMPKLIVNAGMDEFQQVRPPVIATAVTRLIFD